MKRLLIDGMTAPRVLWDRTDRADLLPFLLGPQFAWSADSCLADKAVTAREQLGRKRSLSVAPCLSGFPIVAFVECGLVLTDYRAIFRRRGGGKRRGGQHQQYGGGDDSSGSPGFHADFVTQLIPHSHCDFGLRVKAGGTPFGER